MTKLNVDNQTIMHIRAGVLPPEDILARIIAAKPSVYGACVQVKEGDKFSLEIAQEDAANLSFDELKESVTAAKEFHRSLFFGKDIESGNLDNIQPIPITDADGNPFIALYVEGTLNNIDAGDTTEQSRFIGDVLMPKVLEYCEDFDGEIEKIMAKISSNNFKRDIEPYLGFRSCLHMVPYKGHPVTIQHNNQLVLNGDWGFVSNSLLIPELKKEEPKVEQKTEPAKGNRFFGKTKASVPASPAPAPAADPATTPAAPPPDTGTPGNVDKSVTGKADNGTKIAVKPPSWCQKNDDVKAWYTAVAGSYPQNWKKRIPVMVDPAHPVLQFASVTKLNEYRAQQRKEKLQTTTATPSPEPVKVASSDSGDNLPVLNSIEMNTVLDYVAKHLDGKGREIIDPKEMAKIEEKLPTFSESVGVAAHEMLNWPVSGLFGLAKTEPRAGILMAIEFRNLWRALLEKHGELKDLIGGPVKSETKEEVVTTKTDLGNGSTKTESVVKGGNKFFGKKKVA